jgi:hypothetical protein
MVAVIPMTAGNNFNISFSLSSGFRVVYTIILSPGV